ncbi:MAG: hypothetical protein IPJ33_07855 [Gammaproteobacteria bacterium]|nr:hypothetical protein [Gammaproteobacteria bacterium]
MPLEWMAAAPHVAYAVHMNESKSLPRKASFWKTEPFKLIELREVAAPDGIENEDGTWYRYLISQGDKPIQGHRQGTLASVKEAVDEFVLRLNERRLGTTGRVHFTTGARKSTRQHAAEAASKSD